MTQRNSGSLLLARGGQSAAVAVAGFFRVLCFTKRREKGVGRREKREF